MGHEARGGPARGQAGGELAGDGGGRERKNGVKSAGPVEIKSGVKSAGQVVNQAGKSVHMLKSCYC